MRAQGERDAGHRPLAFGLEVYSDPTYKLTDKNNWWKRYTPPDVDRETWLGKVRKVLILVTEFSPNLK